jgi:hypothetical protein
MSEKYIAIDVLSSKSYYVANICMYPKNKHKLYYNMFKICLYFNFWRNDIENMHEIYIGTCIESLKIFSKHVSKIWQSFTIEL